MKFKAILFAILNGVLFCSCSQNEKIVAVSDSVDISDSAQISETVDVENIEMEEDSIACYIKHPDWQHFNFSHSHKESSLYSAIEGFDMLVGHVKSATYYDVDCINQPELRNDPKTMVRFNTEGKPTEMLAWDGCGDIDPDAISNEYDDYENRRCAGRYTWSYFDKSAEFIIWHSDNTIDRKFVYEFDDNGRLISGNCIWYENGQIVDGKESKSTFIYDKYGRLTEEKNRCNHYFYTYDLKNKCVTMKEADNVENVYLYYDERGNLVKSLWRGSGSESVCLNTYNEKNQLVESKTNDTKVERYKYNNNGDLIEIVNQHYERSKYWEYDENHKIVFEISCKNCDELYYEYDSVGNITGKYYIDDDGGKSYTDVYVYEYY